MITLDQKHFRLTLLTPVHVGSGETLSRGVDILEDRGRNGPTRTFILDVDNLLSWVTSVQADEITRRLASQGSDLLSYLRSLQNVKSDTPGSAGGLMSRAASKAVTRVYYP